MLFRVSNKKYCSEGRVSRVQTTTGNSTLDNMKLLTKVAMAAMVAITKVMMLHTRTILRTMYTLPILEVCSTYRRVSLKAWAIRCEIKNLVYCLKQMVTSRCEKVEDVRKRNKKARSIS